MDISGNLSTNVFLSSLAKTDAVNRVNSQNSSLVEESAERSDTPSRKIRPLTNIATQIRDINDTVSLLQSIKAGYDTISNTLQNLAELALTASDESIEEEQRSTLNKRAEQQKNALFEEINTFQFNEVPLVDQGQEAFSLGVVVDRQGDVTLSLLDTESLFISAGFNDIDLSTQSQAENSADIITTLQNNITAITDGLTQSNDRLDTFVSNLSFTEKEAQETLSSAFNTPLVQDIASLVANQLQKASSVFLQLDPENEKRVILGLLKNN